MIVGITIKNFKAIKELRDLPLDRFHVLVGPNASGKSTFLDALHFARDCLDVGPLQAVEKRAVPDFDDLTFMRRGGKIEISFWLDGESLLASQQDNLLHYRIVVGKDEQSGICLHEESLWQCTKSWLPMSISFSPSDMLKSAQLLVHAANGIFCYHREDDFFSQDSFKFKTDKPALSLTLPDEKRYPTANAVKHFLLQGIRYIQLDSSAMRLPCPATRGADLELDGSNIARVVGRLYGQSSSNDQPNDAIEQWTSHLRYALPELAEIGWGKREADNAEFLLLKYNNGLVCPSWLASDGTLRMLALTLPAFLPPQPGIYMVEEPENGVHPKALEIILRALDTIPEAQVLIATHSPLVVQQVGRDALLCFSMTDQGCRIQPGSRHPILQDWDGTPDLATIFAAGILE